MMGRATEELAERSGNGIGGLLNVTFGNAPELIIALFALGKGLHEVVKASLIGSILGNVLLVMGAAMLVGGLAASTKQKFSQTAASVQSTMLLLAAGGADHAGGLRAGRGRRAAAPRRRRVDYGTDRRAPLVRGRQRPDLLLRRRPVLLAANPPRPVQPRLRGRVETGGWSAAPLGGGAGDRRRRWSACSREILVGSIEETSHAIGLSEFFIGAIVVAIVGNAAEHWVAVLVAYKNKMGLAVNIAIGSSAQIALFVAPVLVLASFVLGPSPDAARLQRLRAGGGRPRGLIANHVTQEGESNWYEGLQLLAVYAILGFAFFYA